MTQWLPQPSFGKGEIAPSLYGRFDLSAISIGAKVIENFIVTRAGGLVNTPGTEFIGEVKDSAKRTRLIKFQFNTQQSYVLEFGDLYMRVIKDGGYVVYDSGPDAGDIFELATPYKSEDLPILKVVQSADVMTITHPAHGIYDLSRLDHDSWTLTLLAVGVQMQPPSSPAVAAVGGSGSTPYSYVVTAVNVETAEESLPSAVVTVNNAASLTTSIFNRITWNLVTASDSARGSFVVGSSGSDAARATATVATTGYFGAYDSALNLRANGTVISTGGTQGAAGLQRLVNSVNTGNSGFSATLSGTNIVVRAPAGIAYNGRTLRFTYLDGTGQGLVSNNATFSGGAVATHSGNFSSVTVNGVNVLGSAVAGTGNAATDAANIASRINSYTSSPEYTATSIGSTVYIYAAASAGATPNGYAVTAPTTGTMLTSSIANMTGGGANAQSGASSYNIYKESNGVYGFIGRSTSNQFEDKNILADVSDTPQEERNPFADSNNPGCATFYEQRKVYAGSARVPQGLWLSQSGNYKNYNVSSPLRADDAITRVIAAREVHSIRHLIPIRELLVLTSGGIWKIGAGGNSDIITPDSMTVRLQSEIGVSHVPPIVIGDTVLYVQEKGSIVRDMGYSFQADNYVGADLSIISSHLFEGREIQEWAYASVPFSVVWAVLDNGQMATMTYLREQELVAWTHQVTLGSYESVAVVSEGNEDAIYVIVRRTIDGETKRYVERFKSRIINNPDFAFFVHCGLTYSGTPVTTVSGLDHLEGETVAILADGNVLPQMVVDGGSITLPVSASIIHVGLPYQSELETLPVGDTQGGIGKRKKVVKLRARVERSRGMWAGPTRSDMTEAKRDPLWTKDLSTDEPEILTVPENAEVVTCIVQQRDPLPLSILALIPEVDI